MVHILEIPRFIFEGFGKQINKPMILIVVYILKYTTSQYSRFRSAFHNREYAMVYFWEWVAVLNFGIGVPINTFVDFEMLIENANHLVSENSLAMWNAEDFSMRCQRALKAANSTNKCLRGFNRL